MRSCVRVCVHLCVRSCVCKREENVCRMREEITRVRYFEFERERDCERESERGGKD